MPKVEQIGPNEYKYNCTCGAEITLWQDFPLKRVVKCWSCGKKEAEEDEKRKVKKNVDSV